MEISCELIRDLADTYLTGNASADTVNAVNVHLNNCDDCKKYYSNYKVRRSPMFNIEFSEPEEEQIAMNLSRLSKRLQMRRNITAICAAVTSIVGLAALLYDLINEHKLGRR